MRKVKMIGLIMIVEVEGRESHGLSPLLLRLLYHLEIVSSLYASKDRPREKRTVGAGGHRSKGVVSLLLHLSENHRHAPALLQNTRRAIRFGKTV